MSVQRFRTLPLLLALILAASPAALAAPPADMATAMPADTLLYVGWSQLLAPDSPELRLAEQAVRTIVKHGTDDPGLQFVAPLLEAIGPLQTGSVGLGLLGMTMKGDEPDVELALVVDAGKDTGKLADILHRFFEKLPDAAPIEPHDVAGVHMESIAIPDAPVRLLWAVHKDRFVMTLGETAAGKVIACLNGGTETLAAAAELKFDRDKVKANLSGRYFCIYGDVRRMVERGKQIATDVLGELPPLVDPLLEELGINSVRSKYLHADRLNDQPRTMIFAHVTGPLHGLLALWDQPPLSDDDLKVVPRDAYWMQVGNLNLDKLWKETFRIIGQLAPDAVQPVEAALVLTSQVLGFSITDDVLPALGDTWAIFDAPDHGGIFMSGTVLVVKVKDPAKFQAMIERGHELLTPLVQREDMSLRVAQTERDGHTIHYIMIAGQPVPVAPAWGFVDGRFVVGLLPQTVAVAMKQVDPKTRGESILDHPDYKAARAQLPKDAVGIAYYDSKYLTRLFYPFVTALGTAGMSMLAQYGVDLDLNVFPPVPDQVAKTTRYVGTSSRDADGILYAGIGDGAPMILVAGYASLATSVMLPSLSRARELSKRAVSGANLRGIGQGCMIYANDNQDKFPASLDVLVKEQMITEQTLQSPLAPWETLAYEYIAGQTMAGDPRNILAYEHVRDDEGTSALFLDGHVEFMKLEPFKQALRDTYQRLGREDEMPPRFHD